LGEAPAQPAAGRNREPLPAALPPNVPIRLALDAHLRSAGAVIGAPVNAHVVSDVRHGGERPGAQGTPVLGVLRQLTKTEGSFVVMIEFSELVLPGGTMPFRARLVSIDRAGIGPRVAGSR